MNSDKRNLLYTIILVSFLPMIVLPINYIITSQFFVSGDVVWILGSLTGLLGFLMLLWEYVLGIKRLIYYFTYDVVFMTKLHKWLGIYGFFFILLHPILLFLEYLLRRGVNLIGINLSTPFDLRVTVGEVAILLVIFTWLTSYLVRKNISYRWWKRFHLLTYLTIPIVYLHADDIGTFLVDPALRIYFKFLLGVSLLIIAFRIAQQFGFMKHKYKLKQIIPITYDTVQLDLVPQGKAIEPLPGQFINFQYDLLGESHPFTVSHFDDTDETISITAKSSGKFSSTLKDLKQGQEIYLDGPYGVFTKEAYFSDSQKIILIAGGIGITPFLRLIEFIGKNPQKFSEVILFNGNKTMDDVPYKSMIEEVSKKSNLKFVNVLSNMTTPMEGCEIGFINCNLIKKYLTEDFTAYKFFICGPPIMMNMVSKDLLSHNVNKKNIFMEEFGW